MTFKRWMFLLNVCHWELGDYAPKCVIIAQWIRLRLSFCSPGFESQAYHRHFFQFILCTCHLNWNVKRMKINQKRPGLAHLKKIVIMPQSAWPDVRIKRNHEVQYYSLICDQKYLETMSSIILSRIARYAE